jgi:hypothetical protein
MFAGHYAPAFAASAQKSAPPLFATFIAVQAMDFAWAGFILTGVERAEIEPGFLTMSDLHLEYMPYSHSLPGALALSLIGALLFRVLAPKQGWSAAMLIGLCVFSHWLLDLLVHAPDLPLWMNDYKVGLSLWASKPITIGLELGLIALGFGWYLLATRAKSWMGHASAWLLFALLVGANLINWFGPAPGDMRAMAISALAAYSALALLALWVDATRTRKAPVTIAS